MYRKTGVTLVLLLLAFTGVFYAWQQHTVRHTDMIRLHVVANSNTFYDQDLKYRVKDRMVSATADFLGRTASLPEARAVLDTELKRIEEIARQEIRDQGFNYPVQVEKGVYYFPFKSYVTRSGGETSSLTLPPGRYEAVRVVIGSGRGDNWWCVLYPPLCFADVDQALPPYGVPPASAVKKQTVTVEDAPHRQPRVEYRFRLTELWHRLSR